MSFLKDAFEDLGNAIEETAEYLTSPEGIITSIALVSGQYYLAGEMTLATAGKIVLTNAALSGTARALTAQPDAYGGRSLQDLASQGSRFQFISPIASRSYSYGTVRTSGVIVQIKTTNGSGGTGTNYLHLTLAISGRPQNITEILLNDVDIYDGQTPNAPRDAKSGTTPDYSSNVQYDFDDGEPSLAHDVSKVLGTPSSTANNWMPDFLRVGNPPNITNWHMGYNITKLGLRMIFSSSLFPEGIPRISVKMQGVDTYPLEIREFIDTDEFIPGGKLDNPALCVLDYLRNEVAFICRYNKTRA